MFIFHPQRGTSAENGGADSGKPLQQMNETAGARFVTSKLESRW
jgi:hypothetical protein